MIRSSHAATLVRILASRGVRLAVMPMTAVAVVSCAGSGVSYTFRVANQDTVTLDSVVIAGGGGQAEFGSIQPGGEARRTIVLQRDALLFLNGIRGQRPVRVVLGGYASRGPAADVAVTVTRGGDLHVGTATPH